MTELLAVSDLVIEFRRGRGRPDFRAVDGVSFTIAAKETLGLVGESGSGKTTIGRAILGLVNVTSGLINFAGHDITHLKPSMRRHLSSQLQAVFQDPYSSLNPTRRIGDTLGEVLRPQGAARATTVARTRLMLDRVGLPSDSANRYPLHFSGGQRQRIAIARALMASPRLLICDEPTSALDLSVQASVLNLLRELQEEFNLSYLFISHDLAVVRHISHRIIVLYRGQIMEQGEAKQICEAPAHPYTQALLAAAPIPDPVQQQARRGGRKLSPMALAVGTAAVGCPYADRCLHAVRICRTQRPSLEATPAGALVACHRWREIPSAGSDLAEPVPSKGESP
jgi:oligopeptide/dipeptide ABC transporter ATP-binding protein